jgi:hypothetical protein
MQWIAIYKDGTDLKQYNEDGSENRYQDIDRTKLDSFVLYQDIAKPLLWIHLETDQRLIYRRRVEKRMDGTETVVYLAGWQQTVKGQNVQSISYIAPDGSIHQAGAFKEDHPWFYPVEPVPCEQ